MASKKPKAADEQAQDKVQAGYEAEATAEQAALDEYVDPSTPVELPARLYNGGATAEERACWEKAQG